MNTMLNAHTEDFVWTRGGRWHLEELTASNGRKFLAATPSYEYMGDPWMGHPYFPMKDGLSNLYLRFARLVDDIWSADYRIGSLTSPKSIQELWPDIEAFLVEYGHPIRDDLQPGEESPDLSEILNQASTLAIAIKCNQTLTRSSSTAKRQLQTILDKIQRYEKTQVLWPISLTPGMDNDEVLEAQALDFIYNALNTNDYALREISIGEAYSRRVGWMTTYWPKSLLGFMWLQFKQALENGTQQKVCQGCLNPFEGLSNQLYCDSFCRGRTNAKKQYAKKRKGGQ